MSTAKSVSPAWIVSPVCKATAARDRRAVELGAVGAAQVAEAAGFRVGFQGEVQARNPPVSRHGKIGAFRAANLSDWAGALNRTFRPASGPEMISIITRIAIQSPFAPRKIAHSRGAKGDIPTYPAHSVCRSFPGGTRSVPNTTSVS